MPAKWVIHTVGPIWQGGSSGEPALLDSAYRSSLQLASEKYLPRIAFANISTGVYGYPKDAAARIALQAFYDAEEQFEEIIMCLLNDQDADIFRTQSNS